jgi:hypothetical protein
MSPAAAPLARYETLIVNPNPNPKPSTLKTKTKQKTKNITLGVPRGEQSSEQSGSSESEHDDGAEESIHPWRMHGDHYHEDFRTRGGTAPDDLVTGLLGE